MIRDLHFAFPSGAYFLIGIPLILCASFALLYYRKGILKTFSASPLLSSQMMSPRSHLYFVLKVLFVCAAWLFAVFALMQPQGNGHYLFDDNSPTVYKSEGKTEGQATSPDAQELIVILDASASMGVKDMHTFVTRLHYAKEIVDALLNQMEGTEFSLYAFTSEITPVVPTTFDKLFAKLMLKNVTINEGESAGTDFLKVTEFIKEEIVEPQYSTHKMIFLLSDGGDTTMEASSQIEKIDREKAILEPLKAVVKEKVPIYTIGIGSHQGGEIPGITKDNQPVYSTLEEALLRKIASQTGGSYYFADEFTPLLLANQLSQQQIAGATEKEHNVSMSRHEGVIKRHRNEVYESYYQIPLLLAILCLSCALLIPDVRKGVIQ